MLQTLIDARFGVNNPIAHFVILVVKKLGSETGIRKTPTFGLKFLFQRTRLDLSHTMTTNTLYFENFKIGQKFTSGTYIIDEKSIQEFATQFDPQPFHTNVELAKSSFFKGLVASGWHTAGIAMRLLVESNLKPAGGLIGAGIEQLKWPLPTYPGDELSLDIEVVDIRRSSSNPNNGILKVKVLTKNQNGETVMSYVAALLVKSSNTQALK